MTRRVSTYGALLAALALAALMLPAKSETAEDFFRGKQIDNLTLTISGGKVTGMTGAGPGYADYKAVYDAVEDNRKNLFAFVDLGINPNVKLPASSAVGTWVPAGAVTVGTGSNTWAGGDNSVSYGDTIFLPGSTVTLDGKAIVENGMLTRFAVQLPLSTDFRQLGGVGMRHSAALGLSERTDALCVVVSEERGRISVAHRGTLRALSGPD